MFLNLSSLRSELLSRLKSNSAILSNARMTQWLNQAQDDIANEFDFQNLVINVDISTVVGRRQYYAPLIANRKIRTIVNTTTDFPLVEKAKATLVTVDPDESDQGSPFFFCSEGMGYIRAAHDSGTITAVSDSNSDLSQKVRIVGRDSNNVCRTEVLTLNGTTDSDGAVTFAEVYSVAKDSTTTGIVTVNINDSDSTVIAILAPELSVDETAPFYVFPTPTAVETLRVRGYRRPRPMVYDQDFPDLPTTYHELVLIGGVIRGHKDLFRVNIAQDIFEKEFLPKLAQLRKDQNSRYRRSPTITGMFGDGMNPSTNLPLDYGAS